MDYYYINKAEQAKKLAFIIRNIIKHEKEIKGTKDKRKVKHLKKIKKNAKAELEQLGFKYDTKKKHLRNYDASIRH